MSMDELLARINSLETRCSDLERQLDSVHSYIRMTLNYAHLYTT